ncbi:MAG: MFS transporter [Saprospiraceae bacterium]|nr:MFS transporter [Saprospiraceae bacterium]
MHRRERYILYIIVIAQFCGTSLWFAGNAILPELTEEFELGRGAVSNLTSAVQFGFIVGTLTFALLNIADRFSPSKVFLFSTVLGSISNILIVVAPLGAVSLWAYRFGTGFFLAGIYPVGMKIAADWYPGKLGKALGYLVGALVLGTAFPHLIRSFAPELAWQEIMWTISGVALTGGFLIYLFVPDGPGRIKTSSIRLGAIVDIFKVKNFRFASFGYFGHMWELYAFWAFVPVILQIYSETNHLPLPVPLWSFLIIGSGFFGCVIGGYWALSRGSAWVAFVQLLLSGICCLFAFLITEFAPPVFLIFLLIWGITVVGDSPQFSTLVAHTAPKELIGTALTITNCIGFSITILSIQLLGRISSHFGLPGTMSMLAIGPVIGLFAVRNLIGRKLTN